jgi:STE24 endopeptidase
MTPTPYRIAAATALLAVLLPMMAWAAPAAFNAEAATQAYLSTLKGAARAKSDAYFEGGYWITLWGTLVAVLSDVILLKTGLSAGFRNWGERVVKNRFGQTALYAVPYVLIGTVLTLPWTIYTGFFREKQYGLMNQGFGSWAWEQAIATGVSVIVFALVIASLMAGIRRSPRRWWLWGTGFSAVFIAFFALLAPVFFAPMFNTYTELKPGPVRDRIVAMAQAKHVPAEHIYLFDQSKQHKRISANVSGLGPTIRISLNDNLLNRSTLPETASVMGHELGHYVLGHVWTGILYFSLLFGAAFFVASRAVPLLVQRFGVSWGLRGVDDVAALPVYAIVIGVIMLLASPVMNSITRTSESAADAFGLDAAKEPDGFASIAMKLSEYRKIEPSALEEILFYDHPSGATRVRMAMAWKAKHLTGQNSAAPQ